MKILIYSIITFTLLNCSSKRAQFADELGGLKVEISEDSLLNLVQYQTFQYFWDGAEPNSGMARERFHVDGNYPSNDMNVVTTGGTGFGLMAIIVGIEITLNQVNHFPRGFSSLFKNCQVDWSCFSFEIETV